MYVSALCSWVEQKSVLDTSFGARLHPEVHCCEHYETAAAMFAATVSPLTVSFARGGEGDRIITSEKTLAHEGLKDLGDVAAFKKAVSKSPEPRGRGWLQQFKDIVACPDRECSKMTFDEVVSWSSSFYLLRPFPPGPRLRDLHYRLRNSTVPIIEYDELAQMKKGEGIMICGCSAFLQRAWCIHSFTDAIRKGIITDYPATMHPGRLPRRGGN